MPDPRVCPCSASVTLHGQGGDQRAHPTHPTSWAVAFKALRKQISKILVFKLSIFIIKIITSLVKVQMLQHGVKTPLE